MKGGCREGVSWGRVRGGGILGGGESLWRGWILGLEVWKGGRRNGGGGRGSGVAFLLSSLYTHRRLFECKAIGLRECKE